MNSTILYAQLDEQLTIAYTDSGAKNKPVILFIHGLANYLQVWHWNTMVLQNEARCIAIDLPGNGHSSRGSFDYTVDFMSKTVIRFMHHLKLDQVILAGHSMGGQIALNTALKSPASVSRLILFAPAGFEYYSPHEAILFKSAITMGNFINMDEVHITQSINSSFYKNSVFAQKIIDDLNLLIQKNDRNSYRRMLDKCINSMLDHQLYYELKNITQKTLVFFGENDMLIPNRFLHPQTTCEMALQAANQMQDATLVTYPETGHFVQIERAAEVNKEVIAFLKATR
jgi:pimeloyl-ACP methyl ester carboxylesterase